MCDFNEVFDDLFPKSWLDPYGKMPMNPGLQASVDITVEESDGFTKVSAVKTPPRSQHMSFQDVLEMALSITSCENGVSAPFWQADDQGKCKAENKEEKDQESEDKPTFSDNKNKFGEDTQKGGEDTGSYGTMKSTAPAFEDRDRNPGDREKSEGPSRTHGRR